MKAVVFETVVNLIRSDCLWVPWEHKSSADHNGGQPRCNWTSQIWNVAHCLGALDRGHCAYTYVISQICRNMMCFHSWIDKLLIFPVISMQQLVEKKSINFCPGVYIRLLLIGQRRFFIFPIGFMTASEGLQHESVINNSVLLFFDIAHCMRS